jgi:hypothetical protein
VSARQKKAKKRKKKNPDLVIQPGARNLKMKNGEQKRRILCTWYQVKAKDSEQRRTKVITGKTAEGGKKDK